MLRGVAGSSGGGSAADIIIGTTTITGGTNTYVLYNNNGVLGNASTLRINATAGQGPSVVAGTATTDVAALSVTRTNNNAAVVKGVEIIFTDTSSAAGFLPLNILGGAAGSTSLMSLSKAGTAIFGGNVTGGILTGNSYVLAGDRVGMFHNSSISGGYLGMGSVTPLGWGSASGTTTTSDVNMSRISAGIVGVGLTAQGQITGGMQMASIGFNAGKVAVSATAPTIASGGCTSPTVTNTNGTAYITIDVGTGCSGSQPVVFTLPAATTGWNCYARNITNGATSAPAQTGAVSTTSVTITNFVRTTGVEGAWTDGDDVVVSCLGG